jgi:PhnB protein
MQGYDVYEETNMSNSISPIPEGFHTATPYLIVPDVASALKFYQQAFGAVVLNHYEDFRNAEIKIGNSPIMIGGHPEIKSEQGSASDLPRVSVYLYVEDVDTLFNQAIAAGAKELYPVKDQPYGNREGGIADPFGIVWWVATRIAEMPKA